jgi:hypothetical protein
MLTGSSLKGQYQHYYYCDSACGVRYNAVETNKKFLELLQTWVLNPERAAGLDKDLENPLSYI